MFTHAFVASTAHKIVIPIKIIISNNGVTKFAIIIFAVPSQTSVICRIFWPNDLMALLWKIDTFIVNPEEDHVTSGSVRRKTDSSVKLFTNREIEFRTK